MLFEPGEGIRREAKEARRLVAVATWRGPDEDIVSVSAGQRGLQILLAPADSLRAVGAAGEVVVGAISRAPAGDAS